MLLLICCPRGELKITLPRGVYAYLVAQYSILSRKPQAARLQLYCHGNFGPAKILVRGTKIPGKFGPPDYYFQKYWSAFGIMV